MKVTQISYTNTNLYKRNRNITIKNRAVNNNLSFKATFWGSVAKGTAAGAAAGGLTGSQIGGTVDLGSMGATMGIPTIAASTAGAVVCGIGGAFAGAAKYFHDEKVKKEKLEKELESKAEEAKKLKEKEDSIKIEMQRATEKAQRNLEKKQKEIEAQRKQIEILSRYDAKKIEEIDGIGLGKIAGYESDKDALNQAFINPYKKSYEDSAADYDVPNGILLYGLSGNGKTTLAKAITDELMASTNSDYVDLSSVSVSKLPDKLREVMNKAEEAFENEHKRTIVFIDEFDRYGLTETHKCYNSETTGYLKTFMNDCAKKGVTIIATTNNPQEIADPLIKNNRRFNVKTLIEPPTKDDISKILCYYLNGLTEGEIDYKKSARTLMNKAKEKAGKYSCSGIEEIANRIKIKARKEKRLINQNDIDEIVKKSNPDINKKQMDKFRDDFEFMSGGTTYEEYIKEKESRK